MRVKSTIEVALRWARRPIPLAIVSAASGAAVVVLFIGLPSMQAESTAAWISATATAFAGIVALYVGLAPGWVARRESEAKAGAMAQIALRGLDVQVVHLGAAINDMCGKVLSPSQLSDVLDKLSMLSELELRDLIPYFGSMSDALVQSVSRCIVDIKTGIQYTSMLARTPSNVAFDADVIAEQFAAIYVSIDDLRQQLSAAIYKQAADDVTSPTAVAAIRARRAP